MSTESAPDQNNDGTLVRLVFLNNPESSDDWLVIQGGKKGRNKSAQWVGDSYVQRMSAETFTFWNVGVTADDSGE